MRRVAIYRHQLFKPSETFIPEQARYLASFRPLFAGREMAGPAPEGSEIHCLVRQKGWRGRLAGARHSLFAGCGPLADALQNRKVALIHAHFGVEGVFALPLARKLGVPLVTTFHGFDASMTFGALVKSGKPGWIRYALGRRRLARQGSRFICVSRHIQRKVLELGFPEARTVQHYIGVDTHSIRRLSDTRPPRRIIHVARLVEKKGTRYLLEAFAKVAAALPEAELVLIGEGPLRPELEQRAERLGIRARVQFRGVQPHRVVLEEIAGSAVLCLPSVTAENGDSEGLGMVLLEAAALELPVVGTQHGGIVEAVIDGKTGFLVPEKDAVALAERLLALLSDDDLRSAMGSNGRQNAVQNFDLATQTAKLEEIYASCL